MTPKQVIDEVLSEYRHNIKSGMNERQALDLLEAMLLDMLEYEKERSFNMGVKSGRFAERHNKLIGSSKNPPVVSDKSEYDNDANN